MPVAVIIKGLRLRPCLIIGALLLIGAGAFAENAATPASPSSASPLPDAATTDDGSRDDAPDEAAEPEGATDGLSSGETPEIVEPVRDPQAELAETREDYSAALAAEQYSQAEAAANQLVSLTREISGEASVEHALAVTDLADVQIKAGDPVNAKVNYLQAIQLIEKQEGIVAGELLRPITGLAAAQNALGEWDRGLETYNRALRINHVQRGLNNMEQMPIRDGLTESYLGLGSIGDANFQQEIQLRIVRDEFGDDLDKLVQASNKLADWYGRSNQQEKEVWQREMTVNTIRSKSGQDATAQIQQLRELAAAYQRIELPQDTELNAYNAALGALREALRVNSESPAPDPLLSADLQIEIGDVHNVFGAPRDARRSYQDAWQTMVAAGSGQEEFDRRFGEPVLIGKTRLPAVFPENSDTLRIWRMSPDRFRPASLRAMIDISDYGRTDNVRIIESSPSNLLDERALYLLKRYQYRPRFQQGLAAATKDLEIQHNYSYLPAAQDADETEPDETDDDESSAPLDYPEVKN